MRRSSILLTASNDLTPPPIVGSQDFVYTGAPETFEVPEGITMLMVDAKGAQGGKAWNAPGGQSGGRGGRVQCGLIVTPGEILQIRVGQKGPDGTGDVNAAAYNGGALGYQAGGSGGGATDIRRGAYALTDRLVVAPGGGGQGGRGTVNENTDNERDGFGGTLVGSRGHNASGGWGGGFGGTQSAGGTGDTNDPFSGDGQNGSLGSGGNGGGQGGGYNGGGGGGGGYYGGGGGSGNANGFYASGGGGGGSGLTTGIFETIIDGSTFNNGSLSLDWTSEPPVYSKRDTLRLELLSDSPSYLKMLDYPSDLPYAGIDWADTEVIPGIDSPTFVRANDTFIPIDGGLLVSGAADMTCLMFIKCTNASDELFFFAVRRSTTPPNGMHSMSLDSGSNNLKFFWYHDGTVTSSAVNLRDGNMHMIAMVKDSGFIRGYVDGVPNGTPVARGGSTAYGGVQGAIGNLGNIGNYGLDGSISTFAYFNNHALSAARIAELWAIATA